MNFWLIQLLGIAGNVIVISSMQFNNRKIVLLAQAISCVLWGMHYGFLGAMTAVTTNLISFARSVLFYYNDRKWAKSRIWLAVFIALFALNSILTWDGLRSILPSIAMTLSSMALWSKNMRTTRILYTSQSPFWIAYNFIAKSYSCALIEIIALISYFLAIVRYDILGKDKENVEKSSEAETSI